MREEPKAASVWKAERACRVFVGGTPRDQLDEGLHLGGHAPQSTRHRESMGEVKIRRHRLLVCGVAELLGVLLPEETCPECAGSALSPGETCPACGRSGAAA